jgi:hypothetical protein
LLHNRSERINNADKIEDWSHEETMAWLAQSTDQLNDKELETLDNIPHFNGAVLNFLPKMPLKVALSTLPGANEEMLLKILVPLKSFLAGGKGIDINTLFPSHVTLVMLTYGFFLLFFFSFRKPSFIGLICPSAQ